MIPSGKLRSAKAEQQKAMRQHGDKHRHQRQHHETGAHHRPPKARAIWLFLVTIPYWVNLLIRTVNLGGDADTQACMAGVQGPCTCTVSAA